MTKIQIPHGSVVVGVDGSEHGERAVLWAARHASLEHRTLTLLHSAEQQLVREAGWLDQQIPEPHELDSALDGAGHSVLAHARDQAVAIAPDLDVVTVLSHDPARVALVDASASAHVLVLGSRGRGPVSSAVLGSVSASVVRRATCPVVVCRPPEARQPRANRVVVGVDGTAACAPVLEFAFAEASLRRWPLTVMHAFIDDAAAAVGPELLSCHSEPAGLEELRLVLAESVAGLREKYPDVEVTRDLNRGLIDDCLADRPPAAALLVIGRTAIPGWRRLLHKPGALVVLERTHTTVAVVPEPRLGPDAS